MGQKYADILPPHLRHLALSSPICKNNTNKLSNMVFKELNIKNYIKRAALHKIPGLIKEQNKKLTHFTLHWFMHEQAEIHSSFFTEVQPKKILPTQKNVNVTAVTSHKKVQDAKANLKAKTKYYIVAVCGLGFSLLIEFRHNKMISYTYYLSCSQVCGCSSNQVWFYNNVEIQFYF